MWEVGVGVGDVEVGVWSVMAFKMFKVAIVDVLWVVTKGVMYTEREEKRREEKREREREREREKVKTVNSN